MDATLQQNILAFGIEADLEEDMSHLPPSEVIILADSLQQALRVGAREIEADIAELDYEILEKGNSGFLGIGRIPYKVRITRMFLADPYSDIEDLNVSLTAADIEMRESQHADGKVIIRVYKNGVFVKCTPPRGDGVPATMESALKKLDKAGVPIFDRGILEKELKKPTGELVKIGNWVPRQDADSSLTVELSSEEMEAIVIFTSPRPGGRHLRTADVVRALENAGVKYGIQEKAIERALENDHYGTPILAAKGDRADDGKDAYIDYKVRINKKVEFKEDEQGRVDFLAKEMVENVVQGQVLAELIPAQSGKEGRTLTNRIIPAKNGKPMDLQPGNGTILSDDGRFLLAEKNGQVVYKQGRLNVEEVLTITGDVGLDTGNILFLGSVVIRGSVADNMQVKAAGNIEIAGNVQKSQIEAEGNIVVRAGIQGRDGARIESTTGSLFAKFIQNTYVVAEKDLNVQEGILHSKIYVGGKIIVNGKRAQIVGGEVMAGESIRVKQLGAQASTPTHVVVGTNPKIAQQIKELEASKEIARGTLDKVELNIRTLTMQKSSMGSTFPPEREEQLQQMLERQRKNQERVAEADTEIAQLREYMSMLSEQGAVHVEKTLFPGVTIEINGAVFEVKDEFSNISLIEENGNIKIIPYAEDEEALKKDWKKRRGQKK